MKKTNPVQEAATFDLTEHHRNANEEQFGNLVEAIQKLRPVLAAFRHHDFAGVPAMKRIAISYRVASMYKSEEDRLVPNIRFVGKWLKELGFHHGRYARVLTLKGLLIVCPENFPDDNDMSAIIENPLIFGGTAA